MSNAKMSRRAMLMGARGIAIALPMLASFRGDSGWGVLAPKRARADGPGAPKRIVFWAGMWGTLHDHWTPKGVGPGFALNTIMAPLAPLKDKLTVLTGLNMASLFRQHGRVGNHDLGGANMLTSAGHEITYPWGPKTNFHHARGPSIDQAIADRLESPTKFRSLFFGDGGNHQHTIAQDTKGNDLTPTYWPNELFDRLFGDYSADAAVREKMRLGRTSVLDSVRPGYESLLTRVSAADKLAVDAHLQAIRDLERRVKDASVCVPGARPEAPLWVGDASVSKNPEGPYRDFVDLMAMAIGCDLSRVLTFSFFGTRAQVKHVVKDHAAINPPNADGDAHSYSHAKWDEPQNQRVWREIQIWRLGLMARLGLKLKEMTDIDGSSVLDNTTIVHTSEVMTGLHDTIPKQEWGYSNPMENPPEGSRPAGLPMFYLGGLGGALKTGTHLDLSAGSTYGDALGKYSHGELYWTLANAMGAGLPHFGDKEVCKNRITEILK